MLLPAAFGTFSEVHDGTILHRYGFVSAIAVFGVGCGDEILGT